jgi:hypothetical protein
MTKMTYYKYSAAIIIITLVIVLAVSARPTQAGLPDQTVPTAKPKKNNTSVGKNSVEFDTITPVSFYAFTPTSTSPSTPTSTEPAPLIAGNSATQTILNTIAPQTETTTPGEKLIPIVLSSDPAPKNPYLYFMDAMIALVSLFLIVFILSRRRRIIPPVNDKKPGPG